MGKQQENRPKRLHHKGIILEEWLPEVVKQIVEQFDPLKIVLFGPLARQEAGRDSEMDLLVVFDRTLDERRMTTLILCALKDLPFTRDVVVARQDELVQHDDLIGTLFKPALMEGRILYDRA